MRGSVRLENEMVYLETAIKIAFTRGITVSDALYIELAKAKGLGPITSDAERAAAARAGGVDALLLE